MAKRVQNLDYERLETEAVCLLAKRSSTHARVRSWLSMHEGPYSYASHMLVPHIISFAGASQVSLGGCLVSLLGTYQAHARVKKLPTSSHR